MCFLSGVSIFWPQGSIHIFSARLVVNFDLAKDLEKKRTLNIRASYEPRKSYIECECLRARYARITQT